AVRRPAGRAVLAGGAGAVALAALLLLTPLGQRTVATLQGVAVGDRITLYAIAARATLTRPLFGYGPDNFRAAFVTHRTAESLPILSAGPETSAHDWLLDASATTGFVGLAALLVVVGLGTVELVALARTRPEAGLPLLVGWSAHWANAPRHVTAAEPTTGIDSVSRSRRSAGGVTPRRRIGPLRRASGSSRCTGRTSRAPLLASRSPARPARRPTRSRPREKRWPSIRTLRPDTSPSPRSQRRSAAAISPAAKRRSPPRCSPATTTSSRAPPPAARAQKERDAFASRSSQSRV